MKRLRRWWAKRQQQTVTDECEVCAEPAEHHVRSYLKDDLLREFSGGSYIQADYCAEHCPGGCVTSGRKRSKVHG